jgi:hypothetical protein
MNPKETDEANLESFDDLIMQVVRDLKTEHPDRAFEVERAIGHKLGDIKVTVEGDRIVCRLVYRNPKVEPLELFVIVAEQCGQLNRRDKKQIYRITQEK